MARTRLDALLVDRGLFETRSRAAAAILAGEVQLGRDGRRADKPGQPVAEDVDLALTHRPRFVSRGGQKLANALDAFGFDPAGRHALDLGASTGGFTDCLLARGAARVAALDVGYGELDWRLRTDERVAVLERLNARALTADQLPFAPDLIVADVSFISVTKVLGPAVAVAAPGRMDVLALVKPQFEVGRERVGRGGVVRAAEDRRAALLLVAEWARDRDLAVLGFASSRLPGPAGNEETFVWLAEPGRPGGLADLETAALRAEP